MIFIFCASLFSQTEERQGSVSFISSQNIYVKFDNTDGISEGDTLFFVNGSRRIPAVSVKFISRTSAAGDLLSDLDLKLNDILTAFVQKKDTTGDKPLTERSGETDITPVNPPENKIADLNSMQRINTKVSVQSYSNFSNTDFGEFQRWRYTLSFNGKHLGDSPVSVRTHLNFNYKTSDWSRIKENPVNNVRVYDLAVKYDLSPQSSLIAGRYLNEKITNISSIDGVQYQGPLGEFNFGLFAGSRPDFSNLGFNLKLFQAGFYVNRTDSINTSYTDNTIAFVNQTNDFKTDRRLIYFQHSNNLINSLSLFLSAEADLYKKVNDESKNEFSLTGLFLSARYNAFKEASFSFSYDARRNVIFYETFKNFLETLLENEMRQGLRFGVTLRPFNNLYAGLNLGYRFRKGDPSPSNDLGAYLSYSIIPLIEVSPSVSFTRIKSSYLDGNIISGMISKPLEFLNSSLSLMYRNSQYSYTTDNKITQHSISADLSARILKQIYLSLGWEGIFEDKTTQGRVLIDLTSRL